MLQEVVYLGDEGVDKALAAAGTKGGRRLQGSPTAQQSTDGEGFDVTGARWAMAVSFSRLPRQWPRVAALDAGGCGRADGR